MAFWLDDRDRILAAMNVNVWDVTDAVRPLIAARHRGRSRAAGRSGRAPRLGYPRVGTLCSMPTHEVFNVPPPFGGGNGFTADVPLSAAGARHRATSS